MANKNWIGDAMAIPQVGTATVTAAGAGGTSFRITHGTTGNIASYLSTASDTTTTIAENLVLAIQAAAAGPAPEFADFNATSSGAVLTITGPADGAPISWSTSVSGGAGTIGAATSVTSPQSPHDYGLAANWSGGTLPVAADEVIFEDGSVDVLYGLTALAAVSLAKMIRRTTYTGRIGLPPVSENGGYIQFRTRYLSIDAASIEWDINQADTGGQFLMNMVSASATAMYIVSIDSPTPSESGNEPVYCYGFVSTSSLNVVGSGVRVSPETGQSSTLPTLNGVNASVYVGPAATMTTVNVNGCQTQLFNDVTTLTIDRGGSCRSLGKTAITTLKIQQGTYYHSSTGAAGAITIGSDGVFDSTFAVSSFSVTSFTVAEGGRLLDPNAKITKNYSITLQNTSLDKVFMDLGTGHVLSVQP